MYVCLCNALKDRQLEAAAAAGAKNVGEVFRRCAARPKCGKCLPDVAKMIEAAQDAGGAIRYAAE